MSDRQSGCQVHLTHRLNPVEVKARFMSDSPRRTAGVFSERVLN